MRDRLSRSKASFDDRIRLRRFNYGCICFIFMAFSARIGEVYILTDPYLRRDYLKVLGDLLVSSCSTV